MPSIQTRMRSMTAWFPCPAPRRRRGAPASHHGGEHYVNDYCWVFTCRDGLIAQIRNFTDTLYADRLFGLDNKTPTAP
jgi:hypothetical protein